MLYLQRKYCDLISFRLQKYSKRNNTINFRCPYCGDSKTNQHKARGYIYEIKGELRYHCHNCNITKSFVSLLKFLDRGLYQEYTYEKLLSENKITTEEFQEKIQPKEYGDHLDSLKRISELDKDHTAYKFLSNRKIPEQFLHELRYTDNYKEFVNLYEHTYKKPKPESRIVIPFYNKEKKLIGFQGRSLEKNPKTKYITTSLDKSVHMIYGLDRVNLNKRYFIVEGPIDSMFLSNSIAATGSDLISVIQNYNLPKENAVMVFDNEKRNKIIVSSIEGAINSGFSVVLFPPYIKKKDINDMILYEGYTPEKLEYEMDDHTFSGMKAKMEFVKWKGF